MAQEERSREMPHSVILEGREKLTISGVTDVHSFDEEQVLLETVRGMLVVRGQGRRRGAPETRDGVEEFRRSGSCRADRKPHQGVIGGVSRA